MLFRHPQPRRTRRPSGSSDSDLDLSDGEDIPESVVGPIEIPKSPSHQVSSRIGSTPGMRAPTHIDFSSSPYTPRSLQPAGSTPAGHQLGLPRPATGDKWPQQLYRQWFGAIIDGRSIQVHSILADHPSILDMKRREPTPFHMALTEVASQSLGIDTSGMDGLQVAIMGYKNAYAHWRLGNGPQAEQRAGMSPDQMKEHVAVREVILGALIDAISPAQLDTHFFGRQKNTTLHLAAFYNDANLVERLLRQGAAVDIPNGMGFLPSGISTDEQTLQWLAAYRSQVRALRYSNDDDDAAGDAEPMHGQHHTPESEYAPDGLDDPDVYGDRAAGSPGARHIAAELELDALEHFSDEDEVSESSYIKQFADASRSPAPAPARGGGSGSMPALDNEHDSASDEDEPAPNASLASSSDRSSLGLGGGLAKRSAEGAGLRRRLLDSGRPASRASDVSAHSDTPPTTANSQSNAPSLGSYHTADDLLSDALESPLPPPSADDDSRDVDRGGDASLRIKDYSASMNEVTVDDIFSDTDDHIMQLEPSFYRSGAGLADPKTSPDSTQRRPAPLDLSSKAAKQQSLDKQRSLDKQLFPNKGVPQQAISAFPVAVANAAQHVFDESGRPVHMTDGSKAELATKDRQRAASPFVMRDSLYEMIMGRSVSRLSMASIGSAYSNALSNTSTLGASRDQSPQQHAGGSGQPQSPTSPTSPTSHISPTSTSFESTSGSPAQTVISSPTRDTGFGTITKPSRQAPEAVLEAAAGESSTVEPAPDMFMRGAHIDSDASSSSSSSSSDDDEYANDPSEGFDGRSPSPVAAPRPTAASLFAMPDLSPGPAVSDAEPADEEPPAMDDLPKAGRIGRRQGRAAAEMLRDEPDDAPRPESVLGDTDVPDRDVSTPAPAPLEFGALPSDAPLTREKRDQYLQTLISRNTMRVETPSKRSAHAAMLQALRSASPAPLSDAGDAESSSDVSLRAISPSFRHASKRSESSLDFLAPRSPSSLGMRERGWAAEPPARPPSSLFTRETLSSGRARSKTVVEQPTPTTPPKPAAQTRKVSPSLAHLKARSLVSNSPAKAPSPSGRELPSALSIVRTSLLDSRARAMTAPIDAPPPTLSLPAATASARIGRVAALSQTFERQKPGPPPAATAVRVLPVAGGDSASPGDKLSALPRPAARSNSVSSSHSAGGHGQHTVASSARDNDGASRPPPHSAAEESSAPPPTDSGGGGGGDDSTGAGGGGGGNTGSGGDGGDDDKPGRDPRAALFDPVGSESNGSTSSHNSSAGTGRGLAASASSSSKALHDSQGSSDLVGSSIFASTDSRDSSDRDPFNTSEPSGLHAPVAARRSAEVDNERTRRFKELANRRKSGTLERMSNSGVVKNRKALFGASDSPMRAASPVSSRPSVASGRSRRSRGGPGSSSVASTASDVSTSSSRARAHAERHGSAAGRSDSPAFLVLQGEELGSRDLAGEAAEPSSHARAAGDLERPLSAGKTTLHPVEQQAAAAEAPPMTRVVSTDDGVDADAALERSLAQARQSAAEPAAAQAATSTPSSRGGSSSDRSRGSNGSGDDGFLMSSLDTNSTPLDSAHDNTNVGLLAQYNMDRTRAERRIERMSRGSGHKYMGSASDGSGADARSDLEFGFTTLGDESSAQVLAEGAGEHGGGAETTPVIEDPLGEEFQTMMPLRPRDNPKIVFGLSTVVEEDESRNSSMALNASILAQASGVHTKPSEQFLEEASAAEAANGSQFSTLGLAAGGEPLRGLRSALGPHLTVAPIYRGLGSVSFPDAMDGGVSPLNSSGIAQATLDITSTGVEPPVSHGERDLDDGPLGSPSLGSHSFGSHSFDPLLVFGYTSEDSSTMASRSSMERNSVLQIARPGSSASRVIYLQPLGSTDFEGSGEPADAEGQIQPSLRQQRYQHFVQQTQSPVASTSRPAPRWQQSSSPLSSSSPTYSSTGKGKQPVRAAPEMQQIQAPDSLPHMPATTVDELEADASTDEDSIPAILFVPSQEFEGYRPIGFEIRDYQDELRQEKRTQKAAAKRAAGQPGATASAAPRHDTYTRAGHRQRKRELEQSTISSRRLREELDATMADDSDAEQMSPGGTIKPLTKRARTGPVAGLFESPEAATGGTRQSFLGSVDIPVSELGEGEQPSGGYPPTERMEDMLVTQEFAAGGQRQQHPAEYDPALMFGPRRRLVLRSNAKNFSERVMEEINGLNVNVRTDVHGAVNVRSAGQFAYAPPAGTVRPSTLPDYVSPLNGVPAGPFFMPPKAEVKSGYLYMRILSVEEMEGDPSSLYFVIRNGIDTLATTPVGIDGPGNTTINQEFRILTDPNVSITMWMRFRSDAIIHRGIRSGRGMLGEPGCVPPLLRRLVRRNTRSRSRRWQCQGPPDSVFDFDGSQSRFAPGARRAGPPSRGGSDLYPARTSSQSGRAYRAGTQPSHGGYNDPRSLNATQAPSSVFYEPGAEMVRPSSSNKGLAQARFREETRGVAVVHVGEMIEEVFLRGLVDSWDVENVWESRCGAQMNLQLFFIPECPLFREEELPRTLSECEMAMEVCAFHNRTLNSGYMSQRGGDTRFWRRRYFRLIGGFLFAYHEESKEPRCFIDLNDATRVVDVQPERGPRAAGMGGQLSTMDLMRSQRMRRPRRPGSHQRNRSDASLRGRDMAAAAHEYASDSEPAEAVDIADPHLQRATPRRPRPADGAAMSPATDSGIVSGASTDDAPDNGMQHSFAIEFGAGGLIEFYTQTEKEKRLWVEIIKRVVGRIPKIPSWLIKLLHADVSDRIDGSGQLGSDPSLGNISTPSSRFEELTHPHPHLRA